MGATDRDLQALTYLARRLREDTYGCGKWDDAGTFAVLKSELGGTNLADAITRVVGHATDPEARTPGAIKRPFTPEPTTRQYPHPIKATDQCPRHPGQRAGNCGGCRADAMADDEHTTPTPSWQPGDATRGADLCRAAIRGGTDE